MDNLAGGRIGVDRIAVDIHRNRDNFRLVDKKQEDRKRWVLVLAIRHSWEDSCNLFHSSAHCFHHRNLEHKQALLAKTAASHSLAWAEKEAYIDWCHTSAADTAVVVQQRSADSCRSRGKRCVAVDRNCSLELLHKDS